MKVIKWCCEAFENHYHTAGERYIAVIVDRDLEGRPRFLIQARAFNKHEEPESVNLPVPMSRVVETVMSYCPWCGALLQQVYGKCIDDLIRPGLAIERNF